MTSVAICYWGMTRSTKQVYQSHYKYLFNILNINKINYNIFMHTWKTDHNTIWEKKCDIPIDYDEYKLLNPNYYKIDNQDDFFNSLNFSEYFNQELFNKYGGDTPHEWRPGLIKNHLCALESQKRVTEMVINNDKKYDYVIYIRPDVILQNDFNTSWLNIEANSISIPNDEHHEGLNDRFAIVPYNNCTYYGKRIDEIIEFRKHNGRIVSEKYVKFIINKYYNNINFINFKFIIIRPR
jgi:hypothetical protein